MLCIVTALHCEAKPFIEFYGLKKTTVFNKLDIFKNEDIILTVSGTGIVKSAIATACLISFLKPEAVTSIFNTGICGSVAKNVPIGTPVFMNKIVHAETGRPFFPDILIKHNFIEGSLQSFSHPVYIPCSTETEPLRHHASDNLSKAEFVDMEAAGFMEAASTFIPAHRIFCVKVVSDHLDSRKISPAMVSGLIRENLPSMHALFLQVKASNKVSEPVLGESEIQLVDKIAAGLKFSTTMKHQLTNLAIQYKLRKNSGLSGFLAPYSQIQAMSKKEGKKYLDELRKTLME